jgi:hypothetical protein
MNFAVDHSESMMLYRVCESRQLGGVSIVGNHRRANRKSAPCLAFGTWDPGNPISTGHSTLPFVIPEVSPGICSYLSDWQMSFAVCQLNWSIRQCTPHAKLGGTTISFSILWEGKILSFGQSGPRIFFGAGKSVGGGILRFNFSKLPTTAGAYR